jgi:mRNA interferase MazF
VATFKPSRGEVWWVDLNPARGHEQSGRWPALVLSVDRFNHGPAGMVIVIPITTTRRNIPLHVEIVPPEGGLSQTSYAKCEDVRAISQERLATRAGAVSRQVLHEVEDRLRILLGL